MSSTAANSSSVRPRARCSGTSASGLTMPTNLVGQAGSICAQEGQMDGPIDQARHRSGPSNHPGGRSSVAEVGGSVVARGLSDPSMARIATSPSAKGPPTGPSGRRRPSRRRPQPRRRSTRRHLGRHQFVFGPRASVELDVAPRASRSSKWAQVHHSTKTERVTVTRLITSSTMPLAPLPHTPCSRS